MVELQCSPIRGGFDSAHLQDIHRRLYQDLYDWAGELRANGEEIGPSIDSVLDRLRTQDLIKGRDPERWAAEVTDYFQKLNDLHPFPGENQIALREFASELATNQLGLAWDQVADAQQQELQSGNLRRLIMLAMDQDPSPHRPARGNREHHRSERESPSPGGTS